MGRGDRPEHTAPPEVFYNDEEARKYTDNTRMIAIQSALTERALELLALPNDGTPRLLLDLGCGSGLSGETLTENGQTWVVSTASSSRTLCRRGQAARRRPPAVPTSSCCTSPNPNASGPGHQPVHAGGGG